MPVVRWEPSRDLVALQNRVNRILGDRLGHVLGEESLTGTVTPPVDIYECADELVLEADLPGMNLEDLDIRVEDNTLTIQGERKQRQDVPEGSYHRAERCYGVFTRSFSLPNTIDAGKIQAGYNNGVLRLTMAKREESKPRQIKVQVK
jgi:HSP20 family protein